MSEYLSTLNVSVGPAGSLATRMWTVLVCGLRVSAIKCETLSAGAMAR